MGFWGNLFSSLGPNTGSAFFTPNVTYLGGAEIAALRDPSKLTAAQMWASQPHFRTVVTFIARNIAQLGLHTFTREGETDRVRDRTSPLAQALADVDGNATTFELIFALVGDLALYDRAYWWVAPSSEMPSGWMIRRLPPTWVEPVMANGWEVKEYRAYVKPDGGFEVIKPEFILAFPGYAPTKMHGASPTVDALRQTLHEQVEAALYRSQVWKRGGRVSSVIERPTGAPEWSDAARESFREDWYAKFTGRGAKAGGTPILEDGMKLTRIDFNAQEQQFVEAAKLSLVTVAAAFHVNPTMIGQNDGANYSNVREFRKMLYGDTLGPLVAQIEARINTFLVPRMGLDRGRTYVEFNIAEKLQGNFEEQAASMSRSIGAPWMTRNEGRALVNLPAILGGDDLVTPLNVLIGGQSSPADGVTAGGGGSAPDPAAPAPSGSSSEFTPDEILKLISAAATLIRSGFDPSGSLVAVGLDPVAHLGLLPITVQRPEAAENPDEEIEDALKAAASVRRTAAARARSGSKSAPVSGEVERARAALVAFFKRQRAAVLSSLGAKADEQWWDEERWNAELGDDLFEVFLSLSSTSAKRAIVAAGGETDAFDVSKLSRYLRAKADGIAVDVNATTRDQITEALDAEDGDPAAVFDQAEGVRSSAAALTMATTVAGFATVEAAKQTGGATKIWSAGPRSRPSHAQMDGETVGIEDDFSNGMRWPGDSSDADEVANCNCSVDFVYP